MAHPQASPPVICLQCAGYGHLKSVCPSRKAYTRTAIGDLIEIQGPNAQPKPDPTQVHRADLFHTICTIRGTGCLMVIDEESRANVIDVNVVAVLNLFTIPHPYPYQLQGVNGSNDIRVTQQALVPFSIGNYKSQGFCDVIPMTTCHLLLGHPWAWLQQAVHNKDINEYLIDMGSKKYRVKGLIPTEVAQAQETLRQGRIEKERLRKLSENQEMAESVIKLSENQGAGHSELEIGEGSERKEPEKTSEEKGNVLNTEIKGNEGFTNKHHLSLSLLQENSLQRRRSVVFHPGDWDSRQDGKRRRVVVFQPGDWESKQAIKRRRSVVFQPGDWDGSSVRSRVGDYTYKPRLPGSVGVSKISYAADLAPIEFEELDSRTNPSEDGGNDEIVRSRFKVKGYEGLSSKSLVSEAQKHSFQIINWDPGGANDQIALG